MLIKCGKYCDKVTYMVLRGTGKDHLAQHEAHKGFQVEMMSKLNITHETDIPASMGAGSYPGRMEEGMRGQYLERTSKCVFFSVIYS